MKTWLISPLIALAAFAGALGMVAATGDSATVEVAVVKRVSDDSLYLLTRVDGEEWESTDALTVSNVDAAGEWVWPDPVAVPVPLVASQGDSAGGVVDRLAGFLGVDSGLVRLVALWLGIPLP
ncbi:MAG: hypothetical protein F4018_05260 [Acidobacteria bacterium]|nr:hypothetical protein [Chloroflexota bacterium]MYK87790.1 hypothetical protein [Acidobacteriota bacterium]